MMCDAKVISTYSGLYNQPLVINYLYFRVLATLENLENSGIF